MLYNVACTGTMEPANMDDSTMHLQKGTSNTAGLEGEPSPSKVKACVGHLLTRKSLSGLKSASNMATNSKSCSLCRPCKHIPVQPVTLRHATTSQQVLKSAKHMCKHTIAVALEL